MCRGLTSISRKEGRNFKLVVRQAMNATEIQVKDRKGKQKAGEGAPVRLRVTPPKKEKAGTQDKGDASDVTQPPEEREPAGEKGTPTEHKEDEKQAEKKDGMWGNEKKDWIFKL